MNKRICQRCGSSRCVQNMIDKISDFLSKNQVQDNQSNKIS